MTYVEIMDINIERTQNVIIVGLTGVLDTNTAPEVLDQVLPLADEGSDVLLDMSGVTYMSSAGLRILLLLYRRIDENIRRIVIIGLHEEVRDVMSITGFLDFFVVADSRQDGLAALAKA